MNVTEMLEHWDNGDSIWSIELGGLGPGYEQAIQVAAVEFARAGNGMPRTEDEKADYESFGKLCDAALKSFDAQLGGITGAMYGQAKWLAWQWCFRGGPDGLIERAKKEGHSDRMIQVSRTWPRVGETDVGGAAKSESAQ